MPSKSKLVLVFVAVLFIINLMLFSIIYITGSFSMSPGSVVPTMLFWAAAAVAVGLALRHALGSYGAVAVLFLCMMASMVGAVLFMDAFALMNGTQARDVRVADALGHADAAVIFFKDGKPASDCVGEIEESDEDSRTTYYAVPYVANGWKKTHPVTVWITCRHDSANCLNGTGVAMIAKTYTAGIAEAEKKCGLTSDPKAIRVEWIGSPEEEIRSGKKYLGYIAAGVNAFWVIAFLGMLAGLRRKGSIKTTN